MPAPSILLLFAHPAFEKSRANRALLEAATALNNVHLHDLYEAYPDFEIDVPHEQDLLLAHDLIVFQHPFYWYSGPALLKQWIDLVLQYGFAYGPEGTALAGKSWLSAITTGGSQSAYHSEGYNRFTIRQFLAPFEQTAVLCGMRYLPPFIAHGMHRRPEAEELAAYAASYARGLELLRDGALPPERLEEAYYLNDLLDDDSPAGDHHA